MDAIKSKRIGDELLEIFQDPEPFSPRENDGNIGIMSLFHRGYTLPNDLKLDSKDFNNFGEIEKYLYKYEKAIVVLPVYMLDHSGITIKCGSFNDPWDSGQIGFIHTTKKRLRELGFNKKHFDKYFPGKTVKEIAENFLLEEVKIYDQYLTGEVYGFSLSKVSKCDHGDEHKDEIDSCWGFYSIDDILTDLDAKWKEGEWED